MTEEPLDLRLVPAALAVWIVTAIGLQWSISRALVGAGLLVVAGIVLVRRQRVSTRMGHRPWVAAGVALLVAAGALTAAALRGGVVHDGPLPELAASGARVDIQAVVSDDPAATQNLYGERAIVKVTVTAYVHDGSASSTRLPVLVLGDASWAHLSLGDHIVASGRLETAQSADLAAVLLADPNPRIVQGAGWLWSGVGAVRTAIWQAVASVPMPHRALLPALVDGDMSQIPDEVVQDMRTAGLTHLLAVSGSNLTLVLGFVLFAARWAGIRGRGLRVVSLVAVVFFVLLARPEPSVLRAAAMGLIGAASLSASGPTRAVRALAASIVVLILVDPWLARSPGFLLSSLATAGIVLFAPGWRRLLARWLPELIADAIAVPLAAQVACTPVIAMLSGQVSLVSVAANLLAAPAVGPATVLTLVAGLAELVLEPVGRVLGWLAGWPGWWIVEVAHLAAGLRGAAVSWSANPTSMAMLVALCIAGAAGLTWLLPRPVHCCVVALVMVVGLLQPWGRIGWPPPHWLMVMCDVGQGDALVLNAGHGAAVVVDAGPDPRLVDRCLDDLDISVVPLLVLTHFHADHIDGVPGVLGGRRVSKIEVSPLPSPTYGAAEVKAWARQAGVPVAVAALGETFRVGAVQGHVIGPLAGTAGPELIDAGTDDGSIPNNASLVIRAVIDGHTFLLAGDAEPEEQGQIVSSGADLPAEVVKVAHHGSSSQDPAFYEAIGARLGLISVGVDNDYGHPAHETLAMLANADVKTYRSDLEGMVAVVADGSRLAVVTTK